jgi:glycerate-2-kinase
MVSQTIEKILEALTAIDPKKVTADNLVLKNFAKNEFYLVAVGKGSAYFATAIADNFPNLISGIVLDIDKPDDINDKLIFLPGDHPLSTKRNVENSKKVSRFIEQIPGDGKIVTVVCGGSSALLTDPINSLDKTIKLNRKLLMSGLSINEINIVRKHTDRLKGGGLAEKYFPRKSLNLYVSDVPGNDLSIIGSGPTVFDRSTREGAKEIIDQLDLNERIETFETPKDTGIFKNVDNQLLLSAKNLIDILKNTFPKPVYTGENFLSKDQDQIITNLKKLVNSDYQTYIFSGESRLKIKDNPGIGGRNTHLGLKILKEFDKNIEVITFASDGHDNSEAAGVIFDLLNLKKLSSANEIKKYLESFDSYNFFKKYDSLIITGHLPVNLSDFLIIRQKSKDSVN